MMKIFYLKYKEIIVYLFFGICTTLVNIVAYYFSTRIFHFNILFSTVLAWCFAVTFAYITNRNYVFQSHNISIKAVMIEFLSFISCRLLTGVIDIGMMYVFVNLLKINDLLIKIAANIFVILFNYFASKLLIFTEHNHKKNTE